MTARSAARCTAVDPRATEVIIIRHGETEWNADQRIQGHLDVELNDFGREQASLVASRIAEELPVSAVYSSDLKRAHETATTIAWHCEIPEVRTDPDLRERHLGDLQGLRLAEASHRVPEAYRALKSRKTDLDLPGGGESLERLFDRCTSAVEKIAGNHRGERVVVVTHGGVVRQLYLRASPDGPDVGKVFNASINVISITVDDTWRIQRWGDIDHLAHLKKSSGFGGDASSG